MMFQLFFLCSQVSFAWKGHLQMTRHFTKSMILVVDTKKLLDTGSFKIQITALSLRILTMHFLQCYHAHAKVKRLLF